MAVNPAVDFYGCKQRLIWIDHALRTLDEDFRMWMLENDPNPITVEYQPEADIHVFRLGVQVPPARFGIVASNIVHQVRATLDNLVWQLVIANWEEPTPGVGGNQFPIIFALKEGRTFADYTRNSLAGVHPHHAAVIEGLQPYKNLGWKPGPHPLAMLANLSNTDKHQVLKIARTKRPERDPADLGVHFGGPKSVEVGDSAYIPGERRYPGAVIGWAQFRPSGPQPDVYMHAELWSQLAFADDHMGVGSVLPTLSTLFAVVDGLTWAFIAPIGDGSIGDTAEMPTGGTLSPTTVNVMRQVLHEKRSYVIRPPETSA